MGPLAPPPINRLPAGFLDFFGVKNGGRYPEVLQPSITPSLDMLDWYAATNSQFLFSSFTMALPAPTSFERWGPTTPINLSTTANGLQVPDNEIWYVQEAGVRWAYSLTAGQLIDFAVAYGIPNATGGPDFGYLIPPQILAGITTNNATNTVEGVRSIQRPFFAPSGAFFVVHNGGVNSGAAAVSYSTWLRITRLKV